MLQDRHEGCAGQVASPVSFLTFLSLYIVLLLVTPAVMHSDFYFQGVWRALMPERGKMVSQGRPGLLMGSFHVRTRAHPQPRPFFTGLQGPQGTISERRWLILLPLASLSKPATGQLLRGLRPELFARLCPHPVPVPALETRL